MMDTALMRVIEEVSIREGLRIHTEDEEMLKPPPEAPTMVNCVVHPLNVDYRPHTSTILEMMYVCQGSITHIINDQEIRVLEKQILLTSPGTTHAVLPTSRGDLAVNITASPAFFEHLEEMLPGQFVISDFFSNFQERNRIREEHVIFDVGAHLPIQNLLEILFASFLPVPEDRQAGYGLRKGWTVEERDRITASCLADILFYLYKDLSAFSGDSPQSRDQMILRSMKKYIENHYQDANLAALSDQLNYSESMLSRTICKLSGHTFTEHLQMYRFRKASLLLQQTSASVAEIAASVGYENYSYFYRKFRDFYGLTPSQYRRQLQNSASPAPELHGNLFCADCTMAQYH